MIRKSSIASVLAAVLALAACDAPTSPRAADAGPALNTSPLTVTILGPTQVPEMVPCTWIADVSGGVPPYEYRWTSPYDMTGFSPYPDYTVAFSRWDGPDWVRVTVRDAANQEVQVGMGVKVTNVTQC